MARAEHGNPRPARGLRKLVTESIALGDRLLQVFLVDLVVRHGHRLPREKGSGSAHPFLGPCGRKIRPCSFDRLGEGSRLRRQFELRLEGPEMPIPAPLPARCSLAHPLLGLGDPLETLEIDERLRATEHLGVVK